MGDSESNSKYHSTLGKKHYSTEFVSEYIDLVAWLSNTHPCSLLQGHLACPGGMGVNVGNSEQEGENQELETEF